MNEKLTVVGFTSYDDPKYPTIALTSPEMHMEVIEIVTNFLKENGYCYSGGEHQNTPLCVPVLSNGTAFRCSMRFWGSIMGSIYSSKEDYMSYYMEVEDPSYPDEEAVVEPGIEDAGLPSFSKEDAQMMQQSIEMGIELLTTDKALNTLYPKLKEFTERNQKRNMSDSDDFTFVEENITFKIGGEDVVFVHIADIKENGHTYGVCFNNEKGVAVMDIKEDGSYTFLKSDTDMELIVKLANRVRDEIMKRQ